MSFFNESFHPTPFKIILFLLLIIPSTSLIIFIIGLFIPYYDVYNLINDPLPLFKYLAAYIGLGVLLSLIIAVAIDYYVKSQNTRILIALICGMLSILVLYLAYKFMTDPVICDPVHNPGNQTVCDPVHRNQQSEVQSISYLNEIKVDEREVNQYLQECLEKL